MKARSSLENHCTEVKSNVTWCCSHQDASKRLETIVDCSFSAQTIEESVSISSALSNVIAVLGDWDNVSVYNKKATTQIPSLILIPSSCYAEGRLKNVFVPGLPRTEYRLWDQWLKMLSTTGILCMKQRKPKFNSHKKGKGEPMVGDLYWSAIWPIVFYPCGFWSSSFLNCLYVESNKIIKTKSNNKRTV